MAENICCSEAFRNTNRTNKNVSEKGMIVYAGINDPNYRQIVRPRPYGWQILQDEVVRIAVQQVRFWRSVYAGDVFEAQKSSEDGSGYFCAGHGDGWANVLIEDAPSDGDNIRGDLSEPPVPYLSTA